MERLPRCLPEWLQRKGITTQKQLVLRLLPYLEWRSKQEVVDLFLQVLPHAKSSTKKSSALDRQILELLRAGLIERAYGANPPTPARSPNATPHRYAYYRRVTKRMPRPKRSMMTITPEGYPPKEVKKPKTSRKRFKKSTTCLTASDIEFIKMNPYGMSTHALGEMFRICQSSAWRIRRGKIPKHLRSEFKKL